MQLQCTQKTVFYTKISIIWNFIISKGIKPGFIRFSDAPYIVRDVSTYQDVCVCMCGCGHLNRFEQMNLCQNFSRVSVGKHDEYVDENFKLRASATSLCEIFLDTTSRFCIEV